MSIIDTFRRSAKFVNGQRIYPTEVELPLWELKIASLISRVEIIEQSVKQISDKPNFTGLKKPSFANYLPESLDPNDYLNYISSVSPIDGREVVEWMHRAFADNAILSARAEEYNSLGSQFVSVSSDAYIPGASVEEVRFQSVQGSTVLSNGYGVLMTPYGNVNIPVGGKATVVFKDLLLWAAIPWAGSIQWGGNIIKWKSLAKTPINQTIGFPLVSDFSAPQFIAVSPRRPTVRLHVIANFSSNESQTLTIKIRNVNDYTRVIAQTSVKIPAGQSNVMLTLRGLPYASTTVWEIQPEDRKKTALNSMNTRP
jgi:hypothetical protein